jgi:hypothetical protein
MHKVNEAKLPKVFSGLDENLGMTNTSCMKEESFVCSRLYDLNPSRML